MAQVKFSTTQLSNPTPAGLNRAVRVFTVVAGIFMGWMATNNIIPSVIQGYISSILGLVIGIINGIAPFFGIEVSGKTVLSKDVTSMENTKDS